MGDMLVRELGISAEDSVRFEEIARGLGLSGREAMRMFVYGFNAHRGFPYDVRLSGEGKPYDVLSDEALAEKVRRQVQAFDPERGQGFGEFEAWLKDEGFVA